MGVVWRRTVIYSGTFSQLDWLNRSSVLTNLHSLTYFAFVNYDEKYIIPTIIIEQFINK